MAGAHRGAAPAAPPRGGAAALRRLRPAHGRTGRRPRRPGERGRPAPLRSPSADPKPRSDSRSVRTFIIRLQEDTGDSGQTSTAAPRLRGVVDEVATGLRATFRNDQELVTALVAAVGDGPPGPVWGGDRPLGEPPSGRPGPGLEEY